MRPGRPSKTAVVVACGRGAAGVDPIAARVVPPAWSALARPARAVHLLLAPLVGLMRARTLAIDAAVTDAARRGSAQLVILGAGLCARAWRLSALRGSIVYEIDHPATQTYKRGRLAGLAPTAREVRFLPVDFERDDLRTALEQAGHDAGAPTTWIWEGVTPYLTPDAIAGTLRTVRDRSVAGSAIAITYYPPSGLGRHPMLRAVSLGARLLGEPFLGLMDVTTMHALLDEVGFVVEDDASNTELAKRMGLRSAGPAIEERLVVASASPRPRDPR